MKQSEIKPGYLYYGKSGSHREVTAIVTDRDGYPAVSYINRGNRQRKSIRLVGFAQWARASLGPAGETP